MFASVSSRCIGFVVTRNSFGRQSRRTLSASQRNFMSTQPVEQPAEDELGIMLILGKPGGGKGTISGKILKVRTHGSNVMVAASTS